MAILQSFPPLLGDGHGRYRVLIVGNSGKGWGRQVLDLTTDDPMLHELSLPTTGIALARILNVPYISMDSIMWQPGWVHTPPEQFQARLRQAMDQEPDRGWVADGDYESRSASLAFHDSTDIVWLDPPLALYLPRLIWRTFLRLLGLREPCSPGCPERVSEAFFSKDSIIWWCISHHWSSREKYRRKMEELGLGIGTNVNGRKMRRLGGWGQHLRNWLTDVEDMVRSHR
ncbi:hypothetical protein CVT26_012512 [Gymnopilus dilepis]|uniref:Adenylate kinase n=1 Tax=Gymnopilus dilepis TaxID=231916 RepID=A0A409YW49_9AGAR|nr:hypothetical protein CVT26_012512 [Gymnopilus dilepis]